MAELKPKSPEFGVRASSRKAKIGKDDLAPTTKTNRPKWYRRMIDALADTGGPESQDAMQIEEKAREKKRLEKTGEVD